MVKRRGGFTLAELIVALLILQVGVIGAATLLVALQRAATRAARDEAALARIAALADSLLVAPDGGAGERVEDGVTLRWSADSAGVRALTAEIAAPGGARAFSVRLHRPPALPALSPP